ncbi:hypothetical protein [Desulfonatronum parangueonense]
MSDLLMRNIALVSIVFFIGLLSFNSVRSVEPKFVWNEREAVLLCQEKICEDAEDLKLCRADLLLINQCMERMRQGFGKFEKANARFMANQENLASRRAVSVCSPEHYWHSQKAKTYDWELVGNCFDNIRRWHE